MYGQDSDSEERITSGEYYETRFTDGRRVYSPTSILASAIGGGSNVQYYGGNSGISNSYNPSAHFESILTRIQNSQAPIEVRNTENIRVVVDGQVIEGIWVNKDESENWRPEHPSDRRNALEMTNLSISSANSTIIKKQFVQSAEVVQNVNIKFLKVKWVLSLSI